MNAPMRQKGALPTQLLGVLQEGPMSRAEIKAVLGFDWRQTTNAAQNLLRRGYLEILEDGRYRLTLDGMTAALQGEVITCGPKGQVKEIRDTLRERAWRSMRMRRAFGIGDLVSDAVNAEDGGQPHDNLRRYVSRLSQAGYIKEIARRTPGTAFGSNGFKRYMLVKNTGPRAPIFREIACAIYDPNTGENVPCKTR